MFKIMKGLEVVEWEKHLNIKIRTRRHNLRYKKERERHNFFINKVAPYWNMLPSTVINSSSLNGFKAVLHNFTENGHYST